MMHLNCVDLFSGAGGLSAGFRKAGFDVIASLESVPVYSNTHAANFPGCRSVTASAENLSPEEFAEKAGIENHVDVLIGGPPCQTFSTIGAPKIRHVTGTDVRSDPRNYLFQSYLDYVSYFRPHVFVMENVPQLRTKYNGVLFSRLLEVAADLGYELHVSVLNAVEYGVPQNRRRLIIVGTTRGATFSFPKPAFGSPSSAGEGQPFRTVRDALEDLPAIYDGCRLGLLPYRKPAGGAYQAELRSASGMVGNNVCRVSNSRAKEIFSHMGPGDRYMDLPPHVRRILPFREDIFHDRLKRLALDEPSWTVLAHIGMDGYMYIHPSEDRTLSVREAARLQSFDDDFVFTGNMREQYIQVGNAVPPLMGAKIAAQVKRSIS